MTVSKECRIRTILGATGVCAFLQQLLTASVVQQIMQALLQSTIFSIVLVVDSACNHRTEPSEMS